jgi:hypothetical protein
MEQAMKWQNGKVIAIIDRKTGEVIEYTSTTLPLHSFLTGADGEKYYAMLIKWIRSERQTNFEAKSKEALDLLTLHAELSHMKLTSRRRFRMCADLNEEIDAKGALHYIRIEGRNSTRRFRRDPALEPAMPAVTYGMHGYDRNFFDGHGPLFNCCRNCEKELRDPEVRKQIKEHRAILARFKVRKTAQKKCGMTNDIPRILSFLKQTDSNSFLVR